MIFESIEESKEFVWNIITSYINDNPHFIVKHQLDSYNDFIFRRIPYTIKSLNPFRVIKNDDNNTIDIKVYIGGENAENIYLDKPVLNTNTETHVLLPNEARLRNITYVSNLDVDIHILYQVYKTNTNQIIKEDKKVFDKVLLGAIPIMLHSKLCNLYGLNEKNLIDMGECPYDQGGYFIIDGKEKVIIAQERGATNKL